MYPFERINEGAKQALTRAQEKAVAAYQPFIGTEHLALALVLDDGAAGGILRELGVTYETMHVQIRRVLDSVEQPGLPRIIPTSRMKRSRRSPSRKRRAPAPHTSARSTR